MHATDLPFSTPRKARIEIIPLIDVIFFLLATFVLFTLSLEKIRAIEVPLPEARQQPNKNDILFLQASDAGQVFWQEGSGEREPVSLEHLPARLADYRSRVAIPRVMIRGDTQATFGAAVRALDEVRRANINEVSIETRPPESR